MMADRFYGLFYTDNPRRPIYFDDAGNLLQISGILVQGMGTSALMLYPGTQKVDNLQILIPTVQEWCDFLSRSDDPLALQMDGTGTVKAIIRKAQRVISGVVQQRIWHRDQWTCMYCGKEIPNVQLTIDHFVPLELGGLDNDDNYLSACRQCNKKKGNLDPEVYCKNNDLDYQGLRDYLSGKASRLFISHLHKETF